MPARHEFHELARISGRVAVRKRKWSQPSNERIDYENENDDDDEDPPTLRFRRRSELWRTSRRGERGRWRRQIGYENENPPKG